MNKRSNACLAQIRDAHVMEEQGLNMLRRVAQKLDPAVPLRAQIESHALRTEARMADLYRLLARADGWSELLSLADPAAPLPDLSAGKGTAAGLMALCTFEHVKIVSYLVLIATAEDAGDTQGRLTFEIGLAQCCAMAAWLQEHLEGAARPRADADNRNH